MHAGVPAGGRRLSNRIGCQMGPCWVSSNARNGSTVATQVTAANTFTSRRLPPAAACLQRNLSGSASLEQRRL
jgi:hypothetical protein